MPANDVYFAWHAERIEGGYEVFLVAARRAMVDATVSSLAAAGLAVEQMDLKPLALVRGMRLVDGLALEWGGSEATLVMMSGGRPRFFRTIQLDAPPEDDAAQLDELALSLAALVKFMRGSTRDAVIGDTTPLALGGRFAFVEDGPRRAAERFPFRVVMPDPGVKAVSGVPWQAHFAGIGLLHQERWTNRLTPSQGGDIRVAA
jgi:hypothetical protein